jgi:hypothetical protein
MNMIHKKSHFKPAWLQWHCAAYQATERRTDPAGNRYRRAASFASAELICLKKKISQAQNQ